MTAEPSYWLMLFLEALVGIRSGNRQPAVQYLQFVEKHRGRQIAVESGGRLSQLARTDVFIKTAHVKIKELIKQYEAIKPD